MESHVDTHLSSDMDAKDKDKWEKEAKKYIQTLTSLIELEPYFKSGVSTDQIREALTGLKELNLAETLEQIMEKFSLLVREEKEMIQPELILYQLRSLFPISTQQEPSGGILKLH